MGIGCWLYTIPDGGSRARYKAAGSLTGLVLRLPEACEVKCAQCRVIPMVEPSGNRKALSGRDFHFVQCSSVTICTHSDESTPFSPTP